jgi:hypothetical protein
MIDYVLYTLVCLFLIILQTAIFPHITLFANCYDLLIPFVLYLAFFRPVVEGVIVTLVVAFIMDSLTGGPFGIFISIYFWFFVGTRWGMRYFHSGTTVFLPFVIGAGVLVENVTLISVSAIITKESVFPPGVAGSIAWQVLWAIITGPFIFMFIKFVHIGLNSRIEEAYANRDGQVL